MFACTIKENLQFVSLCFILQAICLVQFDRTLRAGVCNVFCNVASIEVPITLLADTAIQMPPTTKSKKLLKKVALQILCTL